MSLALTLNIEVVEQPKLDPDNRQLIGHVRINGVDHHVTLFEVEQHGEAQTSHHHPDRLQALADFEDTPYSFMPITYVGRQYLCVITPFAR